MAKIDWSNMVKRYADAGVIKYDSTSPKIRSELDRLGYKPTVKAPKATTPKKAKIALPTQSKLIDTLMSPNRMLPGQPIKRSVPEQAFRQLGILAEKGLSGASAGFLGPSGTLERMVSDLSGGRFKPFKPIKPENKLEKANALLAELGGSIAPIGAIYKPVKAAVDISKLAKSGTALGRAARIATPGAVSNAAYEGARSAFSGDPALEIAKNTAIGGALGGAGDLAVSGLIKGAGKLASRIPKQKQLKINTSEANAIYPETARSAIEIPSKKTLPIQDNASALDISPEEIVIPRNVPKMEQLFNSIDDIERAARDRITSRSGRVMAGLPLDDIVDYSIIGTAKLAKGGLTFVSWSANMVDEFGEGIKPHLKDIFRISKSSLDSGEIPTARMANKILGNASVKRTAATDSSNAFNSAISSKTDDELIASVSSKIDRSPKKKGSIKDFIERFRTEYIDDKRPFEETELAIRGEIPSAEDSFYKTARLYEGVPTKVNEFIKSRVKPIIEGVEESGSNYQELGNYSLMVHAKDVNDSGLVSGFTDEEINAVIKKLGSNKMESARKKLVSVSSELLDELADKGVISSESVSTLKSKWKNYMPLFRSFDDNKIEFAGGLSESLANVASPIKKLKGSKRDVIDPIESMIANIYKTFNATERNKVAIQLGKLANEDTKGLITRLAPGAEKSRKNAVFELVDGKKVYYEVEPDLYRAMVDLDRESTAMVIKFFQAPASLLRAGATLTPEFIARNPMRDIFQAFVVSESGFNPITDFPAGLFQAALGGKRVPFSNKRFPDKLYREFLSSNAGYGNIISMDRNLHKKNMENVIKQTTGTKFINLINGKTIINALREAADTTETATKLGVFRAARRSGASLEESAYRARDIMDFSRSGSSTRNINKVVAFFNANIQGKSKLIRAIKKDPIGVSARGFTAITMPTIGFYLAQKTLSNEKQKRIIDDAPDWLRNTFWLMPVPGTDLVARIPKPFDLAVVFANPVERALGYLVDKDKKSFDNFATETLNQISIPTMLTGLIPILEGATNYSLFRQAPIIPQREQGLNYPDQYDINTSETAKIVAKGVNKVVGGEGSLKNFGSPRIVENAIRGVGGGLSNYATSGIDLFINSLNLSDKPVKPEKKAFNKPVQKAFLVNSDTSSKSIGKIYDARDKLTREKGSAKLKGEPFRQERTLTRIKNATSRISKITKSIRGIQESKSLSAREKRAKMDNLIELRNRIAMETVKVLDL